LYFFIFCSSLSESGHTCLIICSFIEESVSVAAYRESRWLASKEADGGQSMNSPGHSQLNYLV